MRKGNLMIKKESLAGLLIFLRPLPLSPNRGKGEITELRRRTPVELAALNTVVTLC